MKKYFGLLFCLVALNSCDDGDMVFETLTFDSTLSAADCGTTSTINTVFKIDENEALILKIDGVETINNVDISTKTFPFRNQVTSEGLPKIFKINNLNRVIYRVFNDAVSATYFCQDIPPISPSVVSESTTLSNGDGRIEITTKIIPTETPYASVGAIKYQHFVTLKNITFSNADNSTTYESFLFGTYTKGSGVTFPFLNLGPISKCDNGGRLFRIADKNPSNDTKIENLNEVLEFTISDDELAALGTGQANPMYINETHKLIYKIYNSDVSTTFLCTDTDLNLTPTPVIYETFTAENGAAAVGENDATGVIEINKVPNTLVPGQQQTYTYEIRFRNLIFADHVGTTKFKQANITFADYILNR